MDSIFRNENTRQLYHTSEMFYQLLIQTFSFSHNIYLTINNMIFTTHLIMMFLTSIAHIVNCYFEFINPSWILNSKRQPCQNLLKRYIKKFYRQKIKIRKFFPTNNQLLENTDEATRPITNKLPDNWDDLFRNHRELPPKDFQFRIGKQWKTSTYCSERDRKFNNNSPTDCSDRDRNVNNNSPTDRSEEDRKVKNNSPTYRSEG